MKPRLKVCPFCGELGKLVTWYIPNAEPLYQVNCDNKHCQIKPATEFKPNEEAVVSEWNNRRQRRSLCKTCSNREWDMPQCKDCNSDNGFQWYAKEKTDAQV